ncbi:MAG: TIGR00268 family protein [Planctomyces sp.]|nr:TIGR00268 family protein [Planctomyces sp.]
MSPELPPASCSSTFTEADVVPSQRPPDTPLELQQAALVNWFRSYPSAIVAFSGGVDSALVAWAAFQALGISAVAVTAHSGSVSRIDREIAERVAREIGIRHVVLSTNELEVADYRANSPRRCFHCKSTLYSTIRATFAEADFPLCVNGTNADDLGDYRPGREAANQERVRSPLAELGITKKEVRQLAEKAGLTVHDRPASPCLASRVAYGVEVTPERLSRIEAAEHYLRSIGLREFRVRIEAQDLARIEVPVECLTQLATSPNREECVRLFKELGFRQICLDLAGFRSGNLNEFIPLQTGKTTSNHG